MILICVTSFVIHNMHNLKCVYKNKLLLMLFRPICSVISLTQFIFWCHSVKCDFSQAISLVIIEFWSLFCWCCSLYTSISLFESVICLAESNFLFCNSLDVLSRFTNIYKSRNRALGCRWIANERRIHMWLFWHEHEHMAMHLCSFKSTIYYSFLNRWQIQR